MQVPDHAAFALRRGLSSQAPSLIVGVALSLFALSGCARQNSRKDTAAPTLRGAVSIAEPRFIAGGSPATVALSCDGAVRRLDVTGMQFTSEPLPPEDYLAVFVDPGRNVTRYLVRTDDGPALLEGGSAQGLPGWPSGTAAAAATFSPDGSRIAAAPSQGGPISLFIWKVPLQAEVSVPSGEIGIVSLLVWSADGKSLLVTDRDNRLAIFRPPKKKSVFLQPVDAGSEGRITAVDLSPDGDWYLMAANAVVVRSWRLPFMNAQIKAWGRVDRIFFAGGTGEVVTIDETNTAIHWLVNYGNVKSDTTLALGDVAALGVPPAGHHFFVLGRDGTVRAYRASDLAPLGELAGVTCTVAGTPADSGAARDTTRGGSRDTTRGRTSGS